MGRRASAVRRSGQRREVSGSSNAMRSHDSGWKGSGEALRPRSRHVPLGRYSGSQRRGVAAVNFRGARESCREYTFPPGFESLHRSLKELSLLRWPRASQFFDALALARARAHPPGHSRAKFEEARSARFIRGIPGELRNCLASGAILRIVHTHHAIALGSADRALVPLSRGTGGTQNAVATRHHHTRALFIKAHDAE